MLEPESRQELVKLAAAPPLVDPSDELGMIRLDRSSEPKPVAHLAVALATIEAASSSSGTSKPNVSAR